ncbi:MAG TPA: rhodanese-like domain-containing protein [Thermoanaerobaculia bacterium]
MAKNERNPNTPNTPPPAPSSRTPMLILVAGSLAIAGLVAWALTRTVQPAAETPAPLPTAEAPATPATTAAPTTTTTQATSPNAGVTRIGVEELKSMIDRGAVTVVDVRDSVSYTNNHIPGAIHIPFARVESESQYLPKDKPIVAYCT